ncbi:succinate dehydrogenase [Piscinibacter sakaiensis]|nr:succinate dehydrogenase [Piscinibacter sakaiensis]
MAAAPREDRAADAIAQARRWYWQRLSAMVLAVCVVVHLVTLVYAVRSGLSAQAILGRTQGHWGVGAFYALFVVACAVHVPPGLAAIAREWGGFGERAALGLGRAFGVLLLLAGLRAVWAVVAPA